MRLFTSNQVNQVYVVTDYKSAVSGLTAAGHITAAKTADGKLYFQHMGASKEISRSDVIDPNCILWSKHTLAEKMATKLKVATVSLKSTVNNGAPIAGQDYILRVEFDGYVGISPEDSQYWKYGVVHAYTGMTVGDFFARMAASLVANMSREAVELIKVFIGSTEITKQAAVWAIQNNDYSKLPSNGTSLIIKEVEQDWIRGLKQQKRLKFNVVPTEVNVVEGNVVTPYTWGTVIPSDGDTITNGKLMADYEYFHMGERADQYRLTGWPDYVPTDYLVDPSKTYDTVGIHYAYVGPNESSQKSEKDITFVVDPSVASTFIAAINALLPSDKQITDETA